MSWAARDRSTWRSSGRSSRCFERRRSGPETRLVPKGASYAFEDEALEKLTPAQKQLARMGPRNARIIQDKLRQIALAIGIPADRLPSRRVRGHPYAFRPVPATHLRPSYHEKHSSALRSVRPRRTIVRAMKPSISRGVYSFALRALVSSGWRCRMAIRCPRWRAAASAAATSRSPPRRTAPG